MNSQLDHLDAIARECAQGSTRRLAPLSTGERVYVALAANDITLADGYTIAEALARLGPEWTDELIRRWRYAGNPAN